MFLFLAAPGDKTPSGIKPVGSARHDTGPWCPHEGGTPCGRDGRPPARGRRPGAISSAPGSSNRTAAECRSPGVLAAVIIEVPPLDLTLGLGTNPRLARNRPSARRRADGEGPAYQSVFRRLARAGAPSALLTPREVIGFGRAAAISMSRRVALDR